MKLPDQIKQKLIENLTNDLTSLDKNREELVSRLQEIQENDVEMPKIKWYENSTFVDLDEYCSMCGGFIYGFYDLEEWLPSPPACNKCIEITKQQRKI